MSNCSIALVVFSLLNQLELFYVKFFFSFESFFQFLSQYFFGILKFWDMPKGNKILLLTFSSVDSELSLKKLAEKSLLYFP